MESNGSVKVFYMNFSLFWYKDLEQL